MKTQEQTKPERSIVVLTDFSSNAKNAAQYATFLAEQLNANIILFNSLSIPDRGFDSWPSGDQTALSINSHQNLAIEAARLHDIVKGHQKMVKLKIECLSIEGSIAENISAIIQERKNILMVVMGGHKANDNDDILFGDEITEILQKVKCPTMIVPESECQSL